MCTVSSKSNPNSPLQVGDVIVSLNGISLKEVEGGMDAWVKLFVAFGTSVRNLVVQSPSHLSSLQTASSKPQPGSIPASSQSKASLSSQRVSVDAPKPVIAATTTTQAKVDMWVEQRMAHVAAVRATSSAKHAAAALLSNPLPSLVAQSNSSKFKLKSCDTCKVTQCHGIGNSSTCGDCRVIKRGIVPNLPKPMECDFSSQDSILKHFAYQAR